MKSRPNALGAFRSHLYFAVYFQYPQPSMLDNTSYVKYCAISNHSTLKFSNLSAIIVPIAYGTN